MNSFFLNTVKSILYTLLYIWSQFISTYIVMIVGGVSLIFSRPELFASGTVSSELVSILYDIAFSQSSLILLIAGAITFLSLIVFFRLRKKRLVSEAWILPVRITSLFPVVISGIALAFFVSIAIAYIPWPQKIIDSYKELYSLSQDNGLLTIMITLFIAPIIEEIIFRGLVFTRLCRAMPAAAAIILSSTIFGAMHGTLIWAAYGFIGGIAMTLVFMKYRSLIVSMLMHCVFNLFGGYIIWRIPVESVLLDFAIFGAAAALLAGMGIIMYKMPRERIDVKRKRSE